jgi:WD40-like Beta Propeller Repeat
MRTALCLLALILAACRTDSTGTAIQASLLEADDPPRYSDWSAPVNLGAPVNTAAGEFGPFISKNGLSLYFTCDLSCPGGFGGFDLWVARRASVDDPWGPPHNLGPTINTSANETVPTLSLDGHRMFFQSTRAGGLGATDVYVSRRRDERDDFGWQPPENLGSGVNSVAGDAAVALFEDDATGTVTLYFASNRAGGLGDEDIYATTVLPHGSFGPAVLVPELSTPFRDTGPAIRRDGLEMFLTSNRTGSFGVPGTQGGLDLWVATRPSTSASWSTPVNLGSVVNGDNTDSRPALSFDGTELYFHSFRPGGAGAFDLYRSVRARLKGLD